jgi:hypothetical protein
LHFPSTDLPDELIFRIPVKPSRQKYFAFSEAKSHVSLPPSRARSRGALRDRHERWVRDAMDVLAQLTNATDADGEGVWS